MTQGNHMAHVAQLVEHVLGKDEVTRSIRVVGSMPRLTRPGADNIALGDRFNASSVFRSWGVGFPGSLHMSAMGECLQFFQEKE